MQRLEGGDIQQTRMFSLEVTVTTLATFSRHDFFGWILLIRGFQFSSAFQPHAVTGFSRLHIYFQSVTASIAGKGTFFLCNLYVDLQTT